MAAAIHRKISRWLIDHLLWNTGEPAREGFRGWMFAKWRLLVAIAGAALLTWREWVEHHPPEIAIIAVIHFVFVLIAIALVVHLARWFGRGSQKSDGTRSDGAGIGPKAK